MENDKVIKKRKKIKKEKKVKKEKVIKAPKIQTIFCIISILFIIACFIFYGIRLVKYYKIYNPKSETGEALSNLSSKIISSSQVVYEGDGLYISNGNYIYKGEDVNNYIIVSNMLFRIVKINSDKSIDIVLDDYINKLSFDDNVLEYSKSSLHEYLKEEFLPILNQDSLTTTSICTKPIYELSEVNCDTVNSDSYIRLLGITDFLNSINDSKSYLIKDNEYLWLYNHAKDSIWHTNGMNIASSKASDLYGVKPVITLKNSTIYYSGDGTLENPYQIEKEHSINVGTYLDIDDDLYIVYEIGDDYLKVQSNELLSESLIFDKTTNEYKDSSLKTYLEDTYLKELTYLDILKDVKWDNDLESKVGLLSTNDLKFNNSLKNYFLIDKKGTDIMLYNASLLSSRVNIKRNVRPCLGLKKDLNIISGNGSKLAPFIVEV